MYTSFTSRWVFHVNLQSHRRSLCVLFFPIYRCFGPGALCSHSVKFPSWPPPSLPKLPSFDLDRTPSSFEQGIFSTLQQLRNLLSLGCTQKSYPMSFFLTHVIFSSQSEWRRTPGNFAVKFVIFLIIGYIMFQHLTCLPNYALQHVQQLFLRPDLVFLKVWNEFFLPGRFFLSTSMQN